LINETKSQTKKNNKDSLLIPWPRTLLATYLSLDQKILRLLWYWNVQYLLHICSKPTNAQW